jgi:hypothetical protein
MWDEHVLRPPPVLQSQKSRLIVADKLFIPLKGLFIGLTRALIGFIQIYYPS